MELIRAAGRTGRAIDRVYMRSIVKGGWHERSSHHTRDRGDARYHGHALLGLWSMVFKGEGSLDSEH
jgi:hypothetical protein